MKYSHSLVVSGALLTLITNFAWATQSVYIPLGDASKVQIIDTNTHQLADTIDDVGNAHGLAMTPDRRYLVAGSFNEFLLDDPTIPRPEGVTEEEHEKHHDLTATEHAKNVGASFVSIIDTVNRKVIRRVAVSGAVHHVAISPDGEFAVATHPGTGKISMIELRHFNVVGSIETGPAPNYAAFSNDGTSVYVSNTGDNSISEIDIAEQREVQHIATGRAPEHIVLSADGLTLYTNNIGDGTASVISLEDGQVTQTFSVGAAPHGIDLSDDGNTLFATSKGDNLLVAISLESGEKRVIPLSPAPYHLTTVQGTNTLYVSSRKENRIWVIDQATLEVLGEIAIDGIGHQMVVASR